VGVRERHAGEEEATRESRDAAAEAVGASGGPRLERYEVLDMEK
jgi:hypothetical protein